MKRSWLIGAALLLSLSAVACSDDKDEPDASHTDGGPKDSGPSTTHLDGGNPMGIDGGTDASTMDANMPPVGDAGHDAGDAH